jgi:copper chaperone CopZ
MDTMNLTIEGMTCQHCVRAVRGALERIPTVEVESVDIGSATVRYDPQRVTEASLADAIADEGYTAYRVE